jgi:AcrR family transcriptional regulator
VGAEGECCFCVAAVAAHSAPPPPPRRGPTPSRERRIQPCGEHTRRLLLDAAIECVLDLGYVGTSTREISERAGISRGAQQHHFPHKADLVAEAIRRLVDERLADLTVRADQVANGPARVPAAIDLFWESMSGGLFRASVEVWMAARNDAELKHALADAQHHIGAAVTESAERMFGSEIAAHPSFPDDIQLVFNTMRGIALLQIFQPDDASYERQWASARAHLVNHFGSRQQNP